MPIKVQMPQVQTQYFPFNGGLDQVTPPIEMYNGAIRFGNNIEIGVRGGYMRCAGYERYSGLAKPSAATYSTLNCTITGVVNIGTVLTDNAGTSFGTVIVVGMGFVALTKITGAFSAGNIKVAGVTVGTCTGPQIPNGAATSKLDATYTALAANVYRALIAAVPGEGRVLGVHQYNGNVYAFRNNVGNTAAVMYKDSAAGWVAVALGRQLRFAQRTSTVTITIASPGVLTWNAHGMAAGRQVVLTTTGVLPTGFTAGVTYYVVAPAANTFQLAATLSGTPINTTGTQSGTHTAALTAIEIADGDVITGVTSGATATVTRVALSGGTWGTTPSGGLTFATVTGAFVSGEALSVGGTIRVNSASVDSAITLLPNGRYEFQNWNFGGQAGTKRMYGVDGVNHGFEFDGTVFVPIYTGMATDTPSYLRVHKNQLFFAFKGSAQHSGVATPYLFSPLFGASELACGDTITGFLELPGSETSGAMAIYTKNRTLVLYGNDVDDWNLVPFSEEAGGFAYTMQYIGDGLVLDTNGITTLTSTQRYGNFKNAVISDNINVFIDDNLTSAIASCICRGKNQYRLYFSNGYAVYVTRSEGKLLGMTTLTYPNAVGCISSMEGASGKEEIYFGSSNGFVYQAEVGTSFDGATIDWDMQLAFNHFGGPRQLKTFRKAVMEVTGRGYSEFSFGYTLSYGSPEFAAPLNELLPSDLRSFNWDAFTWDFFFWDGRSLSPSEADITGTAENISLAFSGSSAEFLPFTLNSTIMHYTPRRLMR